MVDSAFLRYERVVLNTYKRFESLMQNGDAKPLLLWHALIPMILPIVALSIPRRRGGRILRQILYAITLSITVEIIRYRRVLLGANGYMVGLIMTWWLIWTSTLLFFNDAERDFRRIERVRSTGTQGVAGQQNGHASSEEHKPNEFLGGTDTLVWQPYPQSFMHRLGWTFALAVNMRGPDFSFRISSLDPLPPQLDSKNHSAHETPENPRAKSRIRTAFIRFLLAYIALDVLKVMMIWDPYFMGTISSSPPFPLNHLSEIPGLIRAYRSLLSGVSVYCALQCVTALNPIFFLGLSSTFPNASRAVTATPLDVPWLYADQFGQFAAILDDGLSGTWGKWWHQMFRFGFISTAKWIISFLPFAVSSHRSLRRMITTIVAFGISGLIHSFGSYTQLGEEIYPLSGTFLFFILQAVGIFVQDTFSQIAVAQLKRHGLPPRWLRRIGNMAFVIGWLLFSGNRIADDFAKGGMWLTEPIPFSLLRGWMGRDWLCWRTPWFEYYDDGTFWGSGVRII
ncbi:membrane bound O-acyl transferase family-domain-containing protein [Aspergillus aurantiobrunneus]